MKILFLGSLLLPSELEKYKNYSVAGNKMQYNLLYELSKLGIEITIISALPHRVFPKEKKIFIRNEKKKIFENVDIIYLSYLNLPFLKDFILKIKKYSLVKKLYHENTILFSYNMYPIEGYVLKKMQKKTNCKTVSLIADLTMPNPKQIIKKLYQNICNVNLYRNLKYCNNYIVLNKYVMYKYFPKANCILIDGGINPREFEKFSSLKWEGRKNILYTGALIEYSGILNLINAMKYVEDKTICLEIYGDGPLKEYIINLTLNLKNVTYCGNLSNEKILIAQKQCWALINPRPIDNIIAKETFPSKIFEYLMSERPVISTKLNGFLEEYNDFIIWTGDKEVELAESINFLNKIPIERLNSMALLAKSYLLKNKTWKINAKKIYNFLTKIVDSKGKDNDDSK